MVESCQEGWRLSSTYPDGTIPPYILIFSFQLQPNVCRHNISDKRPLISRNLDSMMILGGHVDTLHLAITHLLSRRRWRWKPRRRSWHNLISYDIVEAENDDYELCNILPQLIFIRNTQSNQLILQLESVDGGWNAFRKSITAEMIAVWSGIEERVAPRRIDSLRTNQLTFIAQMTSVRTGIIYRVWGNPTSCPAIAPHSLRSDAPS